MTDCCLFVCCRPATYVRLVNEIYPKQRPPTGAAKPRKLKDLVKYSVAYPRKFPYIIDEVERRIRDDIKENAVDYVHIGVLAMRELITQSLADDMIGIASVHVTRLLAHLMTTTVLSYWQDAVALFVDYSTIHEQIDVMTTFIPLVLRCFSDTTDVHLQLVCIQFIHRIIELLSINPIAAFEAPFDAVMPVLYEAAIGTYNDSARHELREEAVECFCTLCAASVIPTKVVFAMSALFVQCDKHQWECYEGLLALLKAADISLRRNSLHYYDDLLIHLLFAHARNIAFSSSTNYITSKNISTQGLSGAMYTITGPTIPSPTRILQRGSEAAMRAFPLKLTLVSRILSVARSFFQYKCSPAGAPDTPQTTTVLRLLQPVEKPVDDLFAILQFVAMHASSVGLPIIAAPYVTVAEHWPHITIDQLSNTDRSAVQVVQLVLECIAQHCVKCNRVRMASDVIQCLMSHLIRVESQYTQAPTTVYNLRTCVMGGAMTVCMWLASRRISDSEAAVEPSDIRVCSTPPFTSADICYISYCLQQDSDVLFALSAGLLRHCSSWYELENDAMSLNMRDVRYSRVIIIDTIFNTLCSSQGPAHAYAVSTMWSLLEVVLRGCSSSVDGLQLSLPMILALEDFWVSYPIDRILSDAPATVVQASVELLDSQMIFVATYFTYIAKYYNCSTAFKCAETIEHDRRRLGFDAVSRLAVVDGLLSTQVPKNECNITGSIRFTGINREKLLRALIHDAQIGVDMEVMLDNFTLMFM